MSEENNTIVNAIQGALNTISSESNIIQFSDKPFDKKQYIKVDNSELEDMFKISLSKIPSFAVSATNIASIEQVNKIVEDGVFKVVFKNGVNDKSIADLFKNSEGLLITAYHDENGFNQAGLLSVGENISNKLKTTKVINIVNGIMTVASIAVGCYYMPKINNSLKSIENKIDELVDRDDDNKLSALQAIYEILSKYVCNLNSLNELQLDSAHNIVSQNCQKALEIVYFYEKQIDRLIDEGNFNDEKTRNKFSNYLNFLSIALDVYFAACFVEAIISRNYNDHYLVDSIKRMYHLYNKYYDKWDDGGEWSEKLIDQLNQLLEHNVHKLGYDRLSDRLQDFYCNKCELNYSVEPLNELARYRKRIKLFQNNTVDMYYHDGDVYIDKKYLDLEES